MLIHREALEVVRLCEKPGEQIAPVATYVFVDDEGRVMATDGHMVLRATGLVTEEPDLFMKDVRGADDLSSHALPSEMVNDFLKAWHGEQVILREGPCDDGKGPSILETLDGKTSRRFDSKLRGAVDSPNFNSVIKPPKNPRTVLVSIDLLLTIARALKAMNAKSVRCSIGEEPNAPIYLEATAFLGSNIQKMEIDGALMPMRDHAAETAARDDEPQPMPRETSNEPTAAAPPDTIAGAVDEHRRAVAWAAGSDTGTSSTTIWSVLMTGAPPDRGGDIPSDADDFGRCYRLLELIPSWRGRLSEVAAACPKWGPLVPIWPELDALYRKVIGKGDGWNQAAAKKLYDRLKSVYDDCMLADGWTQTGPGSWERGGDISVSMGPNATLTSRRSKK